MSNADTATIDPHDELPWLEREKIISLTEAQRLTTLSEDTLKRVHADKIVRLSPRRLGMKLRSVLAIAAGTAETT